MIDKHKNIKCGDKINNWEVVKEPHVINKYGKNRIFITVRCSCGFEKTCFPYCIVDSVYKMCRTCFNKTKAILIIDGFKFCSRCKNNKDESEFSNDKGFVSGKNHICRTCSKYKKVKTKYKLSPKEYDELISFNNCKCEICDKELNFFAKSGDDDCINVDHCHKTGKVRGILCFKCNVGLGSFNDDEDRLIKASNYIRNKNNECNRT